MASILQVSAAIKELSGEGVSFFKRLLGPVAETADLLSDTVRFYRWQNSLKTIKRAAELAKENDVEAKEIPLKFLVPFLDAASVEEEGSDLNEIWAKLLVSAAKNLRTEHYIFTDILRKMNPESAQIFQNIPATEHPELSRWVSVIGQDPRALGDEVFEKLEQRMHECIVKRLDPKEIIEILGRQFSRECAQKGCFVGSVDIEAKLGTVLIEESQYGSLLVEKAAEIALLKHLGLLTTKAIECPMLLEDSEEPFGKLYFSWVQMTALGENLKVVLGDHENGNKGAAVE